MSQGLVPNPPCHQWATTWVVASASFTAVLASNLFSVALPALGQSWGLTPGQVAWLAGLYLSANVLAIPWAPHLAASLGRVQALGWALGLAALGATLGSMATGFWTLALGRALQGIGAGWILPLGQTMMVEAWPPHRRGQAMALFAVGAVVGPALGPAFGPVLVTWWGWPSLFAVQLPGFALAWWWWRELPHTPTTSPLAWDWQPWGSLAVAALVLPWALGALPSEGLSGLWLLGVGLWALARGMAGGGGVGAAPASGACPTRSWAWGVSGLSGVVFFGSALVLPWHMTVPGQDLAFHHVLLLAPAALTTAMGMIVAGWATDRWGALPVLRLGLVALAIGLCGQGWDGALGQVAMALGHAWRGLALGFIFSPLATWVTMWEEGRAQEQAVAWMHLSRQGMGALTLSAVGPWLWPGAWCPPCLPPGWWPWLWWGPGLAALALVATMPPLGLPPDGRGGDVPHA